MTKPDDELLAAIERRLLLRREGPLTVGQAAKILGVHPQTLRRLEKRGVVPPARRSLVHGDRLYDPKSLELMRRLAELEVRR